MLIATQPLVRESRGRGIGAVAERHHRGALERIQTRHFSVVRKRSVTSVACRSLSRHKVARVTKISELLVLTMSYFGRPSDRLYFIAEFEYWARDYTFERRMRTQEWRPIMVGWQSVEVLAIPLSRSILHYVTLAS